MEIWHYAGLWKWHGEHTIEATWYVLKKKLNHHKDQPRLIFLSDHLISNTSDWLFIQNKENSLINFNYPRDLVNTRHESTGNNIKLILREKKEHKETMLKSQTCRLGLFTVSSSTSSTADTVSMRSSFRQQNPGETAQQVPAAPGNRGKPRLFENCWHLQMPIVKLKIEKVPLDGCARLRLYTWRVWQRPPLNWKRG